MRSYRQYCSLARTLDVLGDRWTLLIVRELAIRPCRYTDLRDGLPGIATNLLADRLRELQAAGVVTAEAAPPPVATTLYTLTDWGAELRPILLAMGRWGAAGLMTSGQGEDQFRSRWAGIGMEAAYAESTWAGSNRSRCSSTPAGTPPCSPRPRKGSVPPPPHPALPPTSPWPPTPTPPSACSPAACTPTTSTPNTAHNYAAATTPYAASPH